MAAPAFRELALANARELVRDWKTFFFAAVFPFFFLVMFFGMTAVVPNDPGGPDLARMSLPLVLFTALASVAFFGTAVPLVALREKGILRLLGTSPVPRRTLLLAQAPARLLLAAAQITVIIAVTAITGYLDVSRIPALVVSCLLGLAMFGAFGYLVGGRLPSAEATSQALAMLLVVLMFASGLILPLDLLPAGAQTALQALPTTYLADALGHQLVGTPAAFPVWLSYAVLAAGAAVFAGVAARTFRWE
ncbi:MAG: ABC transporter permease [Streptosporangiaceae bacterium]